MSVNIRPKGRRIKHRTTGAGRGTGTAAPRTIAFKEHIQKTLALSGINVSRSLAWQIFKDLIYSTVEFTVADPDKRLPLSGVGTFIVQEGKPRRGKGETHNYVPRFKMRASARINALLEEALPECLKKNVGEAEDSIPVADETPVKKAVKTPVKTPVAKDDTEAVADEAPKKRRGRPKKTAPVAVADEAPKKRRGRPKKTAPVAVADEAPVAVADEAPVAVADEAPVADETAPVAVADETAPVAVADEDLLVDEEVAGDILTEKLEESLGLDIEDDLILEDDEDDEDDLDDDDSADDDDDDDFDFES